MTYSANYKNIKYEDREIYKVMVRVIGRQKLASGGNSGSYLLGSNLFN